MRLKPMLAPNDEPNLDNIKFPIYCSYKLDGIRCLFIGGKMLSRSLKPIQNKQLQNKFKKLTQLSKDQNIILDGELYSPKLTFQEITSCVMTKDYEDKKSIKSWDDLFENDDITVIKHTRKEAFDSIKFHCFDCVLQETFDMPFNKRVSMFMTHLKYDGNLVEFVEQKEVESKEGIADYFQSAISKGYEGLILKDIEGRYKRGRGTLREGLIYKLKPYRTFDAEIKGVVQSTEVDPNAEKKINELGNSVTSKKKDDRALVEKASAFWVEYEGKDLKVMLAMTDEEKENVWKNRKGFIGRIIEYKGMLIGAKEVPRHPVFIRFREDKD
jgi:DNA ligase-1